MANSSRMELIKFNSGVEFNSKTYLLTHNNGNTVLEQQVTIKRKHTSGRTYIELDVLDGFPDNLDEAESLLKLGDWFSRLGETLKKNTKKTIKKRIDL